MNILLTGPTGFIGKRLVRKLASGGHSLFLLVRPASLARAKEMFSDITELTYIEGDIEETDVVKNIFTVSAYLDEIDAVVHMAAFYNLEASLSKSYINNVIGTQNVLHLLAKMKNVKHFHYFSTYAVNPIAQGAVNEDYLLQDDLPFNDEYSKTKNHAEHLVRKFQHPTMKTVIFRPGIVLGDSQTGEMEKADGPYYLFDFVLKFKKYEKFNSKLPFLPLPIKENSFLPVLPVDILTDWCSTIISTPPTAKLRCYHMVPQPAIKTKEFLEASLSLLGLPLKILPLSQTRLIAPFLPLLNIPKQAAFYMNQQTHFDRSHLQEDYPQLLSPHYQQYLPQLIEGYRRLRG